jgi:two-component system chemotaxis response regulator CheB
VNGLVVIGASRGGLVALEEVLGGLPADFPAAVLVVQHRSPTGPDMLTDLLTRHCAIEVCDAEDKSGLEPGRVLVAPAGYHVLVELGHVELSADTEPGFSRPSIDAAFETAAEQYGPRAIGVVLTGANDDGSRGLAVLCRRGGQAIVQDPSTADSASMPDAAIAAVEPAHVLPLDKIAGKLIQLVERLEGRAS